MPPSQSLRYHAPPVAYPVGRSVLLPVFVVGAVVTICLLQSWRWRHVAAGTEWRWWLPLLVGTAVLVWQMVAWRKAAKGWLTWEPTVLPPGQSAAVSGWWWTDESDHVNVPLARVAVGLRWPAGMWLRLYPAGQQSVPRWLWVMRARQPDRWLALLRALQAAS